MSSIRFVTVAGVTGAIGGVIVEALLDAGFVVQALTRDRSSARAFVGNSIKIIEADYSNLPGLISTLKGQDAVISCLGDTPEAVAAQRMMIDAAEAAGVQRFIPSEFGSDTLNERVRSFPFFKHKIVHQDILIAAAARNPKFSYSVLITGPFLDWGLCVVPFIINVGAMCAQVFDDGNIPFSVTRTEAVGKAVASILLHASATRNRVLFVQEAVTTQNQLIARAKSIIARNNTDPASFVKTYVDTATLEEEAWACYRQPDIDPLSWVLPFINLSFWAADRPGLFERTDNALLGVSELKGPALSAMLDAEIGKAVTVFGTKKGGIGEVVHGNHLMDGDAAQKAYESGRQRLVGIMPSQ